MRFLLDTHVLMSVVEKRTAKLPQGVQRLLADPAVQFLVSVASLWEIAIKWRLGKLPLSLPLGLLPDVLIGLELDILAINEVHVLTTLETEPQTRDPFDRLLLAQCQVEKLQLLTLDRALASHPLSANAKH